MPLIIGVLARSERSTTWRNLRVQDFGTLEHQDIRRCDIMSGTVAADTPVPYPNWPAAFLLGLLVRFQDAGSSAKDRSGRNPSFAMRPANDS
jgi:hypothetical protein